MREQILLDVVDLQILNVLQQDASLSNQELAKRVHTSPPTCLRRVKRLHEFGLIERQIAILQPEVVARVVGHGITALVEVTLDRQDSQSMEEFEALACAEATVQQCYRVSPGPDFMLVVHSRDMPSYQQLCQRLFTANANVRNVKSFFSLNRAKFGATLPL